MTKPLRIEADWNTWGFIPTATLQQAVFLSLDLEPIRASHEFNRCLFRVCAHVDKTDPVGFLHEFNRRIKIASAHIEELAKFPGAYHRDIQNAKVSLSKFGTWAKNIEWELPDKFPRQTASEQPIDATDREANASTLVAIKNEPEPAQSATTPALVLTADASGGVEPDKAGPVDRGWVMKKAALIDKHANQWSTIKGDFHSASENGLSKAAKALGHGEWYEAAALNWARQRGKLTEEKQQGPASLATVWTGTKHTSED